MLHRLWTLAVANVSGRRAGVDVAVECADYFGRCGDDAFDAIRLGVEHVAREEMDDGVEARFLAPKRTPAGLLDSCDWKVRVLEGWEVHLVVLPDSVVPFIRLRNRKHLRRKHEVSAAEVQQLMAPH
jgi:hypothetical protein